MLKFGQNVHLWRLHFLAFMPQPVSVAGFATTRRNVIFTDGVRSAGKRRFSRMASRYATKWLLQHPSGPPVCLPSSQQKRNRHFRSFRKMSIPTLRTVRTFVFLNLGVQLRFNQPSRHPWEGILRFLASVWAWLPNGSKKRLNFQNRRISDLSGTGVTLTVMGSSGARSPVQRVVAENSRVAL